MAQRPNTTGIFAALLSPVFLGMAPILGKAALTAGMDPFTVAALRTLVAVGLLWLVYAIFFRRFMFIYPAGLMGCIVIGVINGIGSLFFYGGLGLLDASLAQLLNGTYLVFAVLISHAAGIKSDRRTLLRVLLALIALMLITGFGAGEIDIVGVGLMLGSALMFAGTVTLSQYVLYEMPAQTATLYILTTMCVVVSMVWLVVGQPLPPETLANAALPVLLLGLTTAGSRLAIFAGVKFLGSMQTAIMAVAEIAVSLALAFFLLGDRLTGPQWLGVGVLAAGLLLIRHRDLLPAGYNPNALIVANMASIQFQRIAFHRAFGTHENDNELGTMSALTTQEIIAIGRMLGAQQGSIDPFPISKGRRYLDSLGEEMTPPR
ncbi:MAG TPA: DMT family transporter [Aggregatilineales bacterium]|nr:DMT family transporter [Aggregatilineales bacterium]